MQIESRYIKDKTQGFYNDQTRFDKLIQGPNEKKNRHRRIYGGGVGGQSLPSSSLSPPPALAPAPPLPQLQPYCLSWCSNMQPGRWPIVVAAGAGLGLGSGSGSGSGTGLGPASQVVRRGWVVELGQVGRQQQGLEVVRQLFTWLDHPPGTLGEPLVEGPPHPGQTALPWPIESKQ